MAGTRTFHWLRRRHIFVGFEIRVCFEKTIEDFVHNVQKISI